jgi:hypothetical protein
MRLFPRPRAAAGFATKKGQHRSATPESSHMFSTLKATLPQAAPDLQSTVVLVTPQMARNLRDAAHFDRQRNIAPANVDRLSAEISAGRFTPGTQIYICVLPDGRELIVNGNHTLEAVSKSGKSQVLTITRKEVADENEAGRIYAVFDVQKVRTWKDSLRAVGIAADLMNADRALSAIGLIENSFAQRSTGASSRIDRINQIDDYRDAIELWNLATFGAPKHTVRLMLRAAVMAVALETLRYQPSRAFEFWQGAARDDGLKSNMPEKALLNWLRNVRVGAGARAQAEHARAAALAWNAAFRGDTRSHIKPNSMAAFYLLGTPAANGLGASE